MIAAGMTTAIAASATRALTNAASYQDPVSAVVLQTIDYLTPWWPAVVFWLGAGMAIGVHLHARLRGDVRRMLGMDGGLTVDGLRGYVRQAQLQFRSGVFLFPCRG